MPSPTTDLTLRGTRTFEPPYDDESNGVELTHGSLALALPLNAGEPLPALRLLPGGRTRAKNKAKLPTDAAPDLVDEAPDDDPLDDLVMPAPVRTPRSELPPPRAFGARLVQHLTEATSGERPLAQLAPYLSRSVYQRLERQLRDDGARVDGHRQPGQRPVGARLRTGRRGGRAGRGGPPRRPDGGNRAPPGRRERPMAVHRAADDLASTSCGWTARG